MNSGFLNRSDGAQAQLNPRQPELAGKYSVFCGVAARRGARYMAYRMKFVPLLLIFATGVCFGAIKPALIVEAARSQIGVTVSYDPSYQKLDYPGGDVPKETGVCSDVIVRALRKQGIDLQKQIHEDMAANFEAYPKNWGLKKPDRNIDHRRVPNLMTYFKRKGDAMKVTCSPTRCNQSEPRRVIRLGH
jgi:uncharacterized protein YijF (DUF1287 family)